MTTGSENASNDEFQLIMITHEKSFDFHVSPFFILLLRNIGIYFREASVIHSFRLVQRTLLHSSVVEEEI